MLQAFANDDMETVARHIRATEKTRFPPPIKALWHYFQGCLHGHHERYEDALASYDECQQLRRDMPTLHTVRAVAYNGLGRCNEALVEARKYYELLGEDADNCREMGRALEGLGRASEAVTWYQRGLGDNPQDYDNLLGLARTLPEDQMGELVERFGRTTNRKEALETVANNLLEEQYIAALEALVEAYRKTGVDDLAGRYFKAEALVLRKQYARAADIFLPDLPRAAGTPYENGTVSEFVYCMFKIAKPLEGYRKVPAAGKDLAFGELAEELDTAETAETLGKLVQLHRKSNPKDVRLHYYSGRRYVLTEEYDKADAAYAAGMALKLSEDDLEGFRQARVYARYRAGKIMEAYRDIGPARDTFTQLCGLLSADENMNMMASLVEAHRKACPEDPNVPLRQAQVHFSREEYAPAVKVLAGHQDAILGISGNRGFFERMMIRSLVHLGRYDEALSAAMQSTRQDGDPYYEAVVHAAAGNVAQTLRAMERCMASGGYNAAAFYDDWDMAASLRKKEFAPVRAKFPPPKRSTSQPDSRPAEGR